MASTWLYGSGLPLFFLMSGVPGSIPDCRDCWNSPPCRLYEVLGTKPTVSGIIGNHSTTKLKSPFSGFFTHVYLLMSEDKDEQMMAVVVEAMGKDKGKVRGKKRNEACSPSSSKILTAPTSF